MSWSFNVRIDPLPDPADEDIEGALNQVVGDWRIANPTLVNDSMDEQVETAISAALMLVETILPLSGEHPGRYLSIRMYGHSNPGHVPTGGWAPDTVSVSIDQMTIPPTTAT